ncbi:MAG: prolyl oligopeptidase family serine peptidase [Pseudomonadota bacterium]
MTSRILSVLVALALFACDAAEVPDHASGVGMMRLSYEDDSRRSWDGERARPLSAWVWYPAAAIGPAERIAFPENRPVFDGGLARRDAPLGTDKAPLVLLSHGTGGSAFQMMWLGRRMAEAGFIAVAIDHHGNTAAEEAFDPRGFFWIWERPQDISAVIDRLLTDERFAGLVDADRIGAAGFSLGGYSVAALAGARLDRARFKAFCDGPEADATCEAQTEYPDAQKDLAALLAANPALAVDPEGAPKAAYGDPRVKAVVALAPALGQMMSDDSLRAMETPLLVIGGGRDQVAPVATNARRIADEAPGATLTVIGDAGHYSFLNACTARGRRFVAVCRDAEGVDRSAVHDQAADMVIEHFRSAFARSTL